jgi:hypothetical protein
MPLHALGSLARGGAKPIEKADGMKTEDLIETLASDPRPRTGGLGTSLAAALALGGSVTFLIVATGLGIRPEVGAALADPLTAAKLVLPVILAVAALMLALRLARPAAPLGRAPALLLVPPALALTAIALELVRLPVADWAREVRGETLVECLVLIPLLSLPLLAGALVALRRGAPVSPARAGVAGGLAAGAVATALYALHCPEDSPLFWGLWYSLGLLVPAVIGGLGGARLLRW